MATFEQYLDEKLEEQIQVANERSDQRALFEPRVLKAHYDSALNLIIISVSTGGWFSFRPEDAQDLAERPLPNSEKSKLRPQRLELISRFSTSSSTSQLSCRATSAPVNGWQPAPMTDLEIVPARLQAST